MLRTDASNVLPRSAGNATTRPPTASGSPTPQIDPTDEDDEDDRYVSRQWDKRVIKAFEAHRTATGKGTRIAVIDTGIYADHLNLRENVDLDASVRINQGRTFPSRGRDGFGHGTLVAGVAAASNNGDAGIVGVAPDAELVSVSPSAGGSSPGIDPAKIQAFFSDVILSMEYAASIEADVMNLSLGVLFDLSSDLSRFLLLVADYLAVRNWLFTVVVIASGNAGFGFPPGGRFFDFPGSIPSALTVGATGPNDRRTEYTTYGSEFVDVSAPGGGYETIVKAFCTPDGDSDDTGEISSDATGWLLPGSTVGDACALPAYPYPRNNIWGPFPPNSYMALSLTTYPTEALLSEDRHYGYSAGTSFAAPQVAGVVALVREVAPELSAPEVQRLITETADGIPGESRAELGAGRVNASRAVEAARRMSESHSPSG
ncbi:S8 family peptidase [Haloprofundus halobius]|uniref:S8 family peptidase n=1 Tax=Haloprofundus halobius TaxID=2876194 RepID=UPI001CCC6C3C|nr:S8 family serine peptidase [Haloprofundus halobius]